MRTATYYLTRSSNCSGDLSPAVECWYRRPIRCKLSFDRGYVWMPSWSAAEDPGAPPRDTGLYGSYSVEVARGHFGTIPDTDRECVRVERNVKEAT